MRRVEDVIHRLLEGSPATAQALYGARKKEVDATLRRHKIRKLVAFGSRATGTATPDSDLDLAALLSSDATLFDLVHIQHELSEAFGVHVDVVSLRGLAGRIKQEVDRDGVVLVGS